VCDNVTTKEGRPWKKSARTYGLAVLREEIRKEGKVIGYKDKTVEVAKRDKDGKETGETEERPAYVQISQGYKNFWSGFVGSYDMYGTLLDRDYKITRSGSGPTDTEYLVAAANPMAVKDDDGNKVIMDLRVGWIRDKFYPNAPDLGEIVEGKMNDEFFSHFFLGGSTSDSGDESTEASSNDATESDLAAMADRIKPLGNTNESSDDDEDLMMVAD
jgi:hypothetical protein